MPMLTTIDNPYSPIESYDLWNEWDKSNGYDTESLIGRVSNLLDITIEDLESYENINKIYSFILSSDVINEYILVFTEEEIKNIDTIGIGGVENFEKV